MECAPPQPLAISWRRLGWALYFGINLGMIAYQPWGLGFVRDWALWHAVAASGNPYQAGAGLDVAYVWSPLMVPVVMAVVAVPALWALLHLTVLALPRDAWFALLMLCSWGFWNDVAGANTFTFSVVAGLMAWRGSRPAAIVYIALLMLMPRPVQVPLALLLLWRDRSLLVPSAILVVTHSVVVAPYLADWIAAMVEYGRTTPHDLGPRHFLGYAWVPIALVIAGWLVWKRRPGWAGLFASAYWLPQYFLMPLVELLPKQRRAGPR